MDKAKEFIKDHKKEILVGIGVVVAYKIGYKRGVAKYRSVIHDTVDCLKNAGYIMVRSIPEVIK